MTRGGAAVTSTLRLNQSSCETCPRTPIQRLVMQRMTVQMISGWAPDKVLPMFQDRATQHGSNRQSDNSERSH